MKQPGNCWRPMPPEFRKVWLGFNDKTIVGSCIDIFHKDPSYQRRLLADQKNLPHRADIAVGPRKFSLCVSASYDAEGNHNGKILEWADVTELRRKEALSIDYEGQMLGVNKTLAVIQFRMDGTIITANENFLQATGYRLNEIEGRHHSFLLSETERGSTEYREFWARLQRGETVTGEYRRFGKGGKEVWLQAAYTPVMDGAGKPYKVVKFATDITPQKSSAAELDRKVNVMLEFV